MSELDDAYRRTLRGFGDVEVDDPEALERAEAAVRGEKPGVPRVRAASGEPRLPHWRALLRWPVSEEVRHRSLAMLGLGSNLGDREAAIAEALRRIDAVAETTVAVVSHLYESEPWGSPDQPPYANAVAAVATALRADQLLEECQRIESELGRVRDGTRWGPRPIDIDILLFDDEEWDSPYLKVPHPRMREREFVVVPLLEIVPEVTLPDGTALRREDAVYGRVTGVLGRVPGFEDLTPPESRCGAAAEFIPDGEMPGSGAALASVSADSRGEASVQGWVVIEERPRGHLGALLHKGMLEGAGIPVVTEPPEGVFPLPGVVRLLVPADREAEARRLLLEARAAGRQLESLEDE